MMIAQPLRDLLNEYHADQNEHLTGPLVEHLIGTHDVLFAWGAPKHLCDAGLFHSVYGTQLYAIQSVPFAQRNRIRAAIGERAEHVAYWFCVTERGSLFVQAGQPRPRLYDAVHHQIEPIAPDVIRELVVLEVANALEFMPRVTLSQRAIDTYTERFERVASLVPSIAIESARSALAEQRRKLASGGVPIDTTRLSPQPALAAR